MNTLPLQFREGHLFVELNGEQWLFDTGVLTSFGASNSLFLAGEQFRLDSSYLGFNAAMLSQCVGCPCAGLLGANILGRFDHLLDTVSGTLTISTAELAHSGRALDLDDFMGVPIITAQIAGVACRMFFDTGAQISYFQDDSLINYPAADIATDFYPGFGQFQSDTHEVPLSLADIDFTLRCGTLPEVLGANLMLADTKGIVCGNQILGNRVTGYFPRRRSLVL